MSGAMYKGEEQVAGRTVVITGANSGMGKEMAKEMASRGILHAITSYSTNNHTQ